MTCEKCGHRYPSDGLFCPFCGAKQMTVHQPKNEQESFLPILAIPLFFALLLILGIFVYARSSTFAWDAATLPKIETEQGTVSTSNSESAK